MPPAESPRRSRVERGIYRQSNGNYAVCARHAGRLHFRTVGRDLAAARRAREELIGALAAGKVPASRRLRFDTVAGWWLERFEAKVAAGDRHTELQSAGRSANSTANALGTLQGILRFARFRDPLGRCRARPCDERPPWPDRGDSPGR